MRADAGHSPRRGARLGHRALIDQTDFREHLADGAKIGSVALFLRQFELIEPRRNVAMHKNSLNDAAKTCEIARQRRERGGIASRRVHPSLTKEELLCCVHRLTPGNAVRPSTSDCSLFVLTCLARK